MATHLHVMPMKACLQLDLQRKSDISAHRSTSPGGRGLKGKETAERKRGRQRGQRVSECVCETERERAIAVKDEQE